jgi:diacylglycerol kinase family enzyme
MVWGKYRLQGLHLVQVFMNVATGGFGTEITTQTDEGLKNKLGGAAYFLTGPLCYHSNQI